MVKKMLFICVLVLPFLVFSQGGKICDKSSENKNDINAIKKKCTANKTLKTFKAGNKTTAIPSSRSRMIRKRKINSSVTNASSISGSNKLESVNKETSLAPELELNESKIEKFPFDFVDTKPKFPACSDNTSECFKEQIYKHIEKNFRYPKTAYESGIQGRVIIQFVINEFGDVDEIIARGPNKGEDLEKEAVRIIKRLPKFTPGRKGGKLVKVKHGVPISFKIQ